MMQMFPAYLQNPVNKYKKMQCNTHVENVNIRTLQTWEYCKVYQDHKTVNNQHSPEFCMLPVTNVAFCDTFFISVTELMHL